MQQAEEIKNYIKQRKELLKEQLGKFGMLKDMKNLNKEAYYYQQQLAEYKNLLKDPKKIEQKALDVLKKLPAFTSFMQKNSQFIPNCQGKVTRYRQQPIRPLCLYVRSIFQPLQKRFSFLPIRRKSTCTANISYVTLSFGESRGEVIIIYSTLPVPPASAAVHIASD